MKKIPSIMLRNWEEDQLPEVPTMNPETEWVARGEGVATVKFDGTACMVQDGELYKRYDRKPNRKVRKKRKQLGIEAPFTGKDFKAEPEGWIPCEHAPDMYTGHWPGWVPVDFDRAEDKWHKEAWLRTLDDNGTPTLPSGTYELVGPKVQGNPYELEEHQLWPHGVTFDQYSTIINLEPPRTIEELREWFEAWDAIEGIVWWHPDGRKAKVKRIDFGLPWPNE